MTTSRTPEKQRPTYSWWVIPAALFLMVLVSVLVPHFIRKRTISRLEVLGAKVERASQGRWLIPIDQIPGLGNLSKLPVWMRISGTSNSGQCAEIYRIASLLPSLRELELSDSATVDEHLLALRNWPELQHLSLSNTRITNQCLPSISALRHLTFLNLANTQIDDDGLSAIAGMSELQHLELTGSRVTDDGLKHLKGLLKLRILGLSNTAVSESAVMELVNSLPDLQVTDD